MTNSIIQYICFLGRYFFAITLIMLMPILRRFKWPIIIAVNAGSHADIQNYMPLWLASHFKRGVFLPIGIYRLSGLRLGLVVGAPYMNDELKNDAVVMSGLVHNLKCSWKAHKFAMTGIMTAYAIRHNCFPLSDKSFVSSSLGTPYLIRINIEEIISRHEHLANKPVAVVGFGYTGQVVTKYLADHGFMVNAYDIVDLSAQAKYHNVSFSTDFSSIRSCGVVILLTVSGSDGVDTILNYLTPSQTVLADTHPKVSKRKWMELASRGVYGYDCGSMIKGGFYFPELHRWGRYNLQGCVMQAVVEVLHRRTTNTQLEFDILASDANVISCIEPTTSF